MSLTKGDFITKVEFADGAIVTIGGGGELFVEPGEGNDSALLDDDRLGLIKALQKAEEDTVA